MIDKELLDVLACPESHQGLREATASELAAWNAKIAAGGLKNLAGKPLAEPLEGALVREDSKRLYPIKDGIPVLLIDEGVAL
ncbi:MAG: hypothetical protein L6Q99_01125 [Planctomycetes bacterium]|nr:hypothetical protein [Planctomycetota bacterium]